ncbi:SWIM zinc finger family protein [Dactylosporangium fulvum]|uniref:SWIM zinc finger family protein n=1 Tax=Dactylosporangium fulvum TaxID=53359 RepID=A0ABY5VLR9_9ACTN|nr:SWIM zinc finger family protein [Dactylosporangium fulvum]UWP78512.1 SWIM zinc finger family protein [Dactylosporangium fulvum]
MPERAAGHSSSRSWSHQFITMLESLRMGTTFQQGRRYARAGHVRSVTISTSLVTALVVDEDGETYRSRVAVRAFSAADWSRIERALAGEAIHAARLLAGHLPDDLDTILAGFGLSLFPESLAEIVLDCSCPGWQKPCRHLAAACYVLAESFDADPFGILAWRGRGRDELLEALRGHRVSAQRHIAEGHAAPAADVAGTATFWTAGPRLSPPQPLVPGTVRYPDALLDQLDPLPLTVGRFEVTDVLRDAYRRLATGLPDP